MNVSIGTGNNERAMPSKLTYDTQSSIEQTIPDKEADTLNRYNGMDVYSYT